MKTADKYNTDKKKVVVITDHNTLSENLTSWLKSIYPQCQIYNGDQKENDISFLKNIKPELIIIHSGFANHKEIELLKSLKASHKSAKLIILTFYDPQEYRNFIHNSGIVGEVVKWDKYEQLPFIMDCLLETIQDDIYYA